MKRIFKIGRRWWISIVAVIFALWAGRAVYSYCFYPTISYQIDSGPGVKGRVKISQLEVTPRSRWLGLFSFGTKVDIHVEGVLLDSELCSAQIPQLHIQTQWLSTKPNAPSGGITPNDAIRLADQCEPNGQIIVEPIVETRPKGFQLGGCMEEEEHTYTYTEQPFSIWFTTYVATIDFGWNCYQVQIMDHQKKFIIVQGK